MTSDSKVTKEKSRTGKKKYFKPALTKRNKLSDITQGAVPGTTTGGGAIILG